MTTSQTKEDGIATPKNPRSDEAAPQAAGHFTVPPPAPDRRRPAAIRRAVAVNVLRVLLLAAGLAIWQWGPEWKPIYSNIHFMTRFQISSPVLVVKKIGQLLKGDETGVPSVWPYLGNTLEATILGVVIGMLLGVIAGLLLAEVPLLNDIFKPYIYLLNSTPRIALIPIIVILVGPTVKASIFSSILLIFFLGFFNAYEGAISVSTATINNSKLLGAKRRHIITTLRTPQALVWSFSILPNAISFSLIAVVTTELLTGVKGMGELILSATSQLDATLDFAVVTVLAFVGTVLIGLSILLRRIVLRWETQGDRP